MSETTEHYDRVRRFMELAGQATPDAPAEMDSETRELRARLLMEEALEAIERGLGVTVGILPHRATYPAFGTDQVDIRLCATGEYDPVELLDGCCDVNVITAGTLIAAGLTDAEPQRLVDENNLSKFGPGGYRRDDGKWIKPSDHQPPALAEEIERQKSGDDLPLSPRWCVYHYGADSLEFYDDELQAHRAASWITEETMRHQAESENAPNAPAIVYPVDASGERLPVGPAYYIEKGKQGVRA